MTTPHPVRDAAFRVRADESGEDGAATLPAYCNFLQEAAGLHADDLGVGIHVLRRAGFSWMLARLRLAVHRYAPWGETVTVRTWPSGTRGRLTATRDFVMTDAQGRTTLEGVSDWLYVDVSAQRLARLPEGLTRLAPPGTPHVDLPDGGGRFAALPRVDAAAEIRVRRSDHDFNHHVNNVHYVEWALEAVPAAAFGGRRPAGLDIVFRHAAHAGDVLAAEMCRAGDAAALCQIRRPADGQVLATACLTYT